MTRWDSIFREAWRRSCTSMRMVAASVVVASHLVASQLVAQVDPLPPVEPQRTTFQLADDTSHGQLPTGIRDTQDVRDIPQSPEESLARIKVPDGFHVELFAAEPHLHQPIAFDFDDRGRLWVVECFSHPQWQEQGQDRVVILEDADHDGSFDKRTVFWAEGRYLSGIAVADQGVYLCNTPELIFLPDRDGDDVPDASPTVLLDGWTKQNPHNVINNLVFGPDGWLYGCIGQDAPSNVGRPDGGRQMMTRGIWRYHPFDKSFEVVAQGTVNPWGLDFDATGEAFFTNCVLPHLWHLVRGAYYERRPGEHDDPFVYQRMGPCSDHLHWAGGEWTESRGARGQHGDAGGGHAHTGAMVYTGGLWPEKYRGSFFTGNLHGNRINNDRLERFQSGFIGRHAEDFLFGNSPWFRCLTQKSGPDGNVYISDWHDVGECHDDDGSHRSSGRIYKVVYDQADPLRWAGDLRQESDPSLVRMLAQQNTWFCRRALRLLAERHHLGHLHPDTAQRLRDQLSATSSAQLQLRTLWALYAIDCCDESLLMRLTSHSNENLRVWSLRLLSDRQILSVAAVRHMTSVAKTDSSGLVRLHLASALQQLEPPTMRWDLAEALASRSEDADDENIQLMIWYGIKQLVGDTPDRAVQLMKTTPLPLLRQWIARRITESLR